MKSAAFLLTILLVANGPSAHAEDNFDYASVDHLYVLTKTEAIRFGQFPAFHEFRNIIAKAMASADAGIDATGKPAHVIRLVSNSGERIVHIGETWVRDGEQVARLGPADFVRLDEAIRAREETGNPQP